ncbi:unnamed protein product [Allacma fusca]|uniref:Uncharacterized protein n=1 Tax=Allacma fusca TaxID=39272 RepID=A0A8J2P4U8_9HEXA|nr:unnamed protein product [Allacma fusca]
MTPVSQCPIEFNFPTTSSRPIVSFMTKTYISTSGIQRSKNANLNDLLSDTRKLSIITCIIGCLPSPPGIVTGPTL